MTEEIKTNQPEAEIDIAQEYAKLKENSIPKDQHQQELAKLIAEKNRLATALIKGDSVGSDTASTQNAEELRKEIANMKQGTNLDYISKVVQLGKAVGPEIFCKSGHIKNGEDRDGNPIFDKYTPTAEELAIAQHTLDELDLMVKESNGDPNQFRLLYNQRVK